MRRAIHERNILFLCEDNACLSQMAEAAAKHLAPPRTRIFSAGVKPGRFPAGDRGDERVGNQHVGQKSKGLADVPINDIDLVVSFGDAHKQCAQLAVDAPKSKTGRLLTNSRASRPKVKTWTLCVEDRDKIDKRVFALFLDHWRNVA